MLIKALASIRTGKGVIKPNGESVEAKDFGLSDEECAVLIARGFAEEGKGKPGRPTKAEKEAEEKAKQAAEEKAKQDAAAAAAAADKK